eukprot:TRINITY_DN6652_c0_g1_i2.p1 TRINITY_DN6652_c0_g1~~TRINITY_DN6652_c0_g1_i2.p1  ORF type:complete len:208 (+),score=55.75 TRINITY_DN6652_c0_g1_i2:42-626(+)
MSGRGENAATRKRKASKDVASKTSWEDTLQEVRDRIEKLTDKDLRPEMIKRNIPGVGKLTKQEKIDAIMCYEKAQSLYQANQSVSSSSSTTPASSDSHGSRKKIEEQRNCIIDRLATNMEEILHQRKKQRVAVEEDEIQSHLATVAKMTEIIISLQEESQRATGEGKKDVEDEISYYRKKRRELREKTLDFTKK